MSNTRTALALSGLALVAGFFMPWEGVTGTFNGYHLATSGLDTWMQLATWFIPLAGLSLLGAGAFNSKSLAAVGAAGLVSSAGYYGFQMARAFFTMTSYGLWLVLIAGLIAVVVALVALMKKKPS